MVLTVTDSVLPFPAHAEEVGESDKHQHAQ